MEWVVYRDIGHDDWQTVIDHITTLDDCLAECLSWGDGPCKSCDWLDETYSNWNYGHRCYIRNFDKHDKAMESWNDWYHTEHCIGKEVLSSKFLFFVVPNNYMIFGCTIIQLESENVILSYNPVFIINRDVCILCTLLTNVQYLHCKKPHRSPI